MVKTKTWVIVIALVYILLVLTSVVSVNPGNIKRSKNERYVNVYRDGMCIFSKNLQEIEEPLEFKFDGDEGTNVLLIEKERVRMISADCKDKICVNTGWVANEGQPIVCLPHKLVVVIESDQVEGINIDTVTR